MFEEHPVIHDFARLPSSSTLEIADEQQQCSYPFSIYLPGTLPPSMDFDDTEGGGCCSVQYQLTARLVGGGGGTRSSGNQVLHAEHPLSVVGATLSPKKYPYLFQPKIFPLKPSLGLLHRGGYLILAARVENTHVGKGHDLHLSLSCRNRSDHYVQSVDVHLLECIHWSTSAGGSGRNLAAAGGGHGDHKTHNSKTITLSSYTGLVLDGLQNESQDKSAADQHDKQPPQQVDPLVYAEMHNDLLSEGSTVSIRLPDQARDTYKGKLIQVAHFLRISLTVKNRKASDPTVDIPITVCDPPIEMHSVHPPIPSRKIETIATTRWIDGPEVAIGTPPHYDFEAT